MLKGIFELLIHTIKGEQLCPQLVGIMLQA